MLFFIVYIVIFICITRQVILKAQKNQKRNNPSNNGSQVVYTPPKTDSIAAVNAQKDNYYQHYQRLATQPLSVTRRELKQEKQQQQLQQKQQMQQMQQKQQQSPNKRQTVQKETGKKPSTTDYLERKAKMDQMEHAREKQEEIRRVNQRYGGQRVGGRYLIGDPIPRGMKLFYCPYCGAENIVSADYRSGMDCYFCRTELK